MSEATLLKTTKPKKKKKWYGRDFELLFMVGIGVAFLVIFAYLPIAGITLAFKDGNKRLNILAGLIYSDWTINNFVELFGDAEFWATFKNTMQINLLFILFNFPAPIIFALLINEVRHKAYKTTIQTICNFPHFLSWVVYGGIVIALTDPDTGVMNPILELFGLSSAENPIDLNLPQYFYAKIIIASMIKGVGWGSIIYTASIAGIDPTLYEAAEMDGANRLQKALYVTLPGIKSTIMVFLLLQISRITNNSFEQFYVFQTTANLSRTRVLSTYMYSLGFTYRNYSTATALGLFEGIISITLLTSLNFVSKKTTGESLY